MTQTVHKAAKTASSVFRRVAGEVTVHSWAPACNLALVDKVVPMTPKDASVTCADCQSIQSLPEVAHIDPMEMVVRMSREERLFVRQLLDGSEHDRDLIERIDRLNKEEAS